MKPYKRISALLLGLLAVLLVLPGTASAAGAIDLDRDVSLTISYQDGETPLFGAQFDLYLAATVDEAGELTPAENLAQLPVSFYCETQEEWAALATTLEGYVLRDQILPLESGTTDDKGLLTFPKGEGRLTPGMYLVVGHRHMQNETYYDPASFLVMLPGLDEENEWIYDVTVKPKYESRPTDHSGAVMRKVLKVWKDDGREALRPESIQVQLLRDGVVYETVTLNAENDWRYTWDNLDDSYQWTVVETEQEGYTVQVEQAGITFVLTNTYDGDVPETPDTPDTPSKPKLPQTGQLWWPVPVLAAAGLLSCVVGLVRRRGANDEEK